MNFPYQLMIGAMIISLAPIFVRISTLAPTSIGIYRAGIAGLLLLPYSMIALKTITRRQLFLFAVGGLAFGVDLMCWHRSVHWVGAGLGTLLANTQVFHLSIFGMIFNRERLSRGFLLAACIGLLGVFLLTRSSHAEISADVFTWGAIYGLIAGFLYAVYVFTLTLGMKIGGVGSLGAMGIVSTFAFIVSIASSFLEGTFQIPVGAEWWPLVALAFFCQILGWTWLTKYLPRSSFSIGAIVLLAQPVLATVLSMLFFGETFETIQVVGMLLTLGSIFFAVELRRR